MAQKVIFEEQTIDGFALDSNFGVHSRIFDQFDGIEPFTLVVGETYEVTWGDNTHTCVAQDASAVLPGVIGLGNCAIVGLSGNNEPFAIAWAESGVTFLVMDGSTDTSHTIGIYQETETTAIILKDRDGNDQQYDGGLPVRLLLEDGTEQTYIPGEAQEKTVAPNFSAGDVVVKPDAGKLLTKVTIPTPDNLRPANIAEGVDIAGIVGTLAAGGGGGNIAVHKMTVTGTGSNQTFTHGLGVVPDIVFGYMNSGYTKVKGKYVQFMGCSGAFGEKYGYTFNAATKWHSTDGYVYVTSTGTKIDQMYYSAALHNATEQTIDLGGSDGLLNGVEYTLYFITGLT